MEWDDWYRAGKFDWRIVDSNRRTLLEGRSAVLVDLKGRVWPVDVQPPWADEDGGDATDA